MAAENPRIAPYERVQRHSGGRAGSFPSMRTVSETSGVVRYIWSHPANRGRRLRTLWKAAQFQARGRLLNRRTLVPIGERSVMWAELHRRGSSRAVYANPPDVEMLVWQRCLRPGDLFLDIGANVGIYSLIAAELGAEVIAAEPDPDTADRLRENIALNHYSVQVVECAVAAENGTSRFTTGLDTVNHFDTDGGREVATRAIDDIIGDRRARGVKIDVEGFEELVLQGAQRALQEHRLDLLQIEWSGDPRTTALLRGVGYDLWCHDGLGGLTQVVVPAVGEIFARPHDSTGAVPSSMDVSRHL